jgi:hypothetical protein
MLTISDPAHAWILMCILGRTAKPRLQKSNAYNFQGHLIVSVYFGWNRLSLTWVIEPLKHLEDWFRERFLHGDQPMLSRPLFDAKIPGSSSVG